MAIKKRSLVQTRTLNRPEVKTEYEVLQMKQRAHELAEIMRARNAMDEFYAGIDPRRRREFADGGMVEEDPKAIANLSPVAIHCEYPKSGFKWRPFYQDDITFGV